MAIFRRQRGQDNKYELKMEVSTGKALCLVRALQALEEHPLAAEMADELQRAWRLMPTDDRLHEREL